MRQCRERIGACGVTLVAGAGDRRQDRKTGPGPSNHAGIAVKCRQNLRQVSPELPSNVAGIAVKCRQILHPLGGGVSELRIDYGPGWRVYFCRVDRATAVLLAGGDKATQRQDIERARGLAQELVKGKDR